MSEIQTLLDRLRAMYIPASLQLELQPRLSREDAEKIIAHITTLERELAEAKKENGRLRTQLAACASDAKAALRMVRFTGEGVYGDYYTDEQD